MKRRSMSMSAATPSSEPTAPSSRPRPPASPFIATPTTTTATTLLMMVLLAFPSPKSPSSPRTTTMAFAPPAARLSVVRLAVADERTRCRDLSHMRTSGWATTTTTTTTSRSMSRFLLLSSGSASCARPNPSSREGGGFFGRIGPLFARGRPRASASVEEDDDDIDFDDDDDDDEEGEDFDDDDDDIEIGSDDSDEDYDDEDDDLIEYEDEEEEELEEEDFDDDEDEIGDDELVMEEEITDDEDEVEIEKEIGPPTANADVWASYDAVNEEPPVPLSNDVFTFDPNYLRARESVLSQVEERKALADLEARGVPTGSLNSEEKVQRTMEYIVNQMTDEERAMLEKDTDLQEVERILSENNMLLSEEDLKDVVVKDDDGNMIIDPKAIAEAGKFEDDRGLDAFPRSDVSEDGENLPYPPDGSFTEKDLIELDDKISAYKEARRQLAEQTFFGEDHTMAYMDVERDWPKLSNETQDEILEVLENSNTMACPEPEMWLMYDLNFNVTNLILASFRHNPEAPIMFTQWMPQLEVYERYADQRAKDFQWTWDDVEQADMTELERYYRGIGYDSIPKKEPGETGIITLDTTPMDDEEREMLALENWMDEVYDEESDNLLFDDENFEPRDNVFDPDYGSSGGGDKSSALEEKFMREYEAFEREFSEETQEWRDQFATVERFEYVDDPEGQKEFRGHLVVACSPVEDDLDVAEKIHERFKEEFGKAVFVETRVLGHARAEDNVFEVWLESYEIDLLHSRRQAFINSKLWKGPSDVDEEQLEYLVEQVRYLISDDARYSYRMSDYADIKA